MPKPARVSAGVRRPMSSSVGEASIQRNGDSHAMVCTQSGNSESGMAWPPSTRSRAAYFVFMGTLADSWFTRRLRARPPRPDDAEAIFLGWATDVDVTRYLTWRPHQSIADTTEFIGGCIDAWGGPRRRAWGITPFHDDRCIGTI